jgi:predicted ribosomally synthesized peptide with SipW-like signal peptide
MTTSRKRLYAGAAAVVAAAALTGAGTYSFFTDTETVDGQSVSTGTLTLQAGTAPGSVPIALDNLAPGDPARTTTITLQNTGSLPGRLLLDVIRTDDSDSALADKLRVKVATPRGERPLAQIRGGTLNGNVAQDPADFGVLQPGATRTVVVEVSLPGIVGNEVQGQSVAFEIESTLEQLR